jgi:hypothetical protein
VGPSAKIKVKVTLEDIYTGREIPVSFSNETTYRLPTIVWSSAHIVEEVELIILRMFKFALSVMEPVLLLRPRDLGQALSNNSKRHALLAMEKERKLHLSAMCVTEISKLKV